MERYVAIDNVCAWPNLTVMPDGAIVATIFNQPCHGRWEGDVECWGSEDGGRTWRLRGVPAPHEPGTNRMNVAAGLAANGDLVVIASGWSHRPRKGEEPAGHQPPAHPLLPWVCRSADGGRTWARADMMPPSGVRNAESAAHVIPFGDIVRVPDGSLGVCIYGRQRPSGHHCYCYASDDDGRTWRVRGLVQEGDITETTPLALPDGHLLACARTLNDQHLEMLRSVDHGRTWQREQAVSQPMQHPAHLLRLADGRILLTYGDRREGHQGIEVRVSDDAGRTWNPPVQLVALDPSDLGYPATVPAGDGKLVTAWYCSGIAAHQRYHMGVLVWEPDERL